MAFRPNSILMNRGQTVIPSNGDLESPWLDYNTLEQKMECYATDSSLDCGFCKYWTEY